MSETDPLTGIANRRAFIAAVEKRAARLKRGGAPFALAMIDLDGFKPINDTFGHGAGDGVLQQVAGRLVRAFGSRAMIARMGGDEFALLVPRCGDPRTAQSIGQQICDLLDEPILSENRAFRISACAGLTLLSEVARSVSEALTEADLALYGAKQKGRSSALVFSSGLSRGSRRRAQIERALQSPECHPEMRLLFQPIRNLETMQLSAFEALARWDSPQLGNIAPSEFIPIAEQTNVITAISERLLTRAASEAGRWPEDVRLSFNLSTVQLCTSGSVVRMLAILDMARLDPSRLQVEVTETALLADFASARENLERLRAAGTRIVLDDFGAGHASISYLREMCFDGIKLDGALIASAGSSTRGRQLLKGVLELCASMGLPCVAEHIEDEAQLALLQELGCRDGQGYLLGHPLEPAAAAKLSASTLSHLRAA